MPQDQHPEFPAIRLELLEETDGAAPGFLRVVRRRYVAIAPDGSRSEPFVYDEVGRKSLDAAIIAAHFDRDGTHHVYLRSALRPPVASRHRSPAARHEPVHSGSLWELPAGLVDATEQRPDGPRETARRETLEELGFDLPLDTFQELGPATLPTPGVISERHYFFECEVDPSTRGEPQLDGSPLEAGGTVIAVPLADALEWGRRGGLEDAKTELGLRRLAELLS